MHSFWEVWHCAFVRGQPGLNLCPAVSIASGHGQSCKHIICDFHLQLSGVTFQYKLQLSVLSRSTVVDNL